MSTETKRVLINITSYNREAELKNIINQLEGFDLKVWDDCSDFKIEYTHVWDNKQTYYQYQNNFSKKRAWAKFENIFDELKKTDYDYYIFMPEDVELCEGFVNKSIELWDSIDDSNKISLSFQDDKRVETSCFTCKDPVDKGNVILTQWNDLFFICSKTFLDKVEITEVPIDRWDKNPLLSSGVGSMISHQMVDKGLNMYHSKESMAKHIGSESKMNFSERKINKL